MTDDAFNDRGNCQSARDRFSRFFSGNKMIIGMLHLAGSDDKDRVKRALRETDVYEREGINGVIVEDYHGDVQDVRNVLCALGTRGGAISVGVNCLHDGYEESFSLARKFGAKFIQVDAVAGNYKRGGREVFPAIPCRQRYLDLRRENRDVFVFGGVWPKYYTPADGSNLRWDLFDGKSMADAIVVTGQGTGVQTPIEKIVEFRNLIGNVFPLIVGAGVNSENAREQLRYADGDIVGSYFKPNGKTLMEVDRYRVKDFMDVVRSI